jgi:hypothetical protein
MWIKINNCIYNSYYLKSIYLEEIHGNWCISMDINEEIGEDGIGGYNSIMFDSKEEAQTKFDELNKKLDSFSLS